jgi:hypothetical protein
MRYVNPLVEGSSPSPVTKAHSTRNMQETLRNEGFLTRFRSELSLSSSRTETNENDAERPPVTTEITTPALPVDRAEVDPDLAEIVDAWSMLPESARADIRAMVRSALKLGKK